MTKEELKNYSPKGELEGFPKEIIARMLECQKEQGNTKDISVFERQCAAGCFNKGFTWDKTKEGDIFWLEVIGAKNFNLFFEKYPKKDNSQYFRVGDKVLYYITNQIGIIKEVKKHKFDNGIDVVVDFGDNDICKYVVNSNTKRPFLLHYREDYNYDVIDFNNLPKRQNPKRWRAENGRLYYFVNFYIKDWFFSDETEDVGNPIDNINYNSGNYFSTEVEAEIIAQKLNSYMKQLIQEEHEHKKN